MANDDEIVAEGFCCNLLEGSNKMETT